jgi:hypothetical protein
MHRNFAAWLTEQPWRAALTVACFGALFPQGLSPFSVVAGAVPVLIVLHRDARQGLGVALTGMAATGTMLLFGKQSVALVAAYVAMLYLAPLGLAMLLLRLGSLNLCFQLAVLGAALVLAIVHAVLDDPTEVWKPVLHEVAKSMANAGINIDQVLGSLAQTLWGSFAAIWLVTILGAVFLGRWWQSLLVAPGEFGKEFRQLSLGTFLGIAATVVAVAAFFFNVPLLNAIAWVAVTGLAFQGLAVAHRRKADGKLKRGWLAVIYVLLLMPLSAFLMVTFLAGWGFADNWRRLRAKAA